MLVRHNSVALEALYKLLEQAQQQKDKAAISEATEQINQLVMHIKSEERL